MIENLVRKTYILLESKLPETEQIAQAGIFDEVSILGGLAVAATVGIVGLFHYHSSDMANFRDRPENYVACRIGPFEYIETDER